MSLRNKIQLDSGDKLNMNKNAKQWFNLYVDNIVYNF